MMELSRRVNEQLILLETISARAAKQMETGQPKPRNRQEWNEQINKPPHFPPFSGTELTPKDECGIETLLFQVKGARKDVTDHAVHSALISCLRGGGKFFS